ncbi:MAG: hypothetical protein GY847_23785 [Proteobacteria bacterium]|nr:hypothetical protein [Pseudomonadota bacterium]
MMNSKKKNDLVESLCVSLSDRIEDELATGMKSELDGLEDSEQLDIVVETLIRFVGKIVDLAEDYSFIILDESADLLWKKQLEAVGPNTNYLIRDRIKELQAQLESLENQNKED